MKKLLKWIGILFVSIIVLFTLTLWFAEPATIFSKVIAWGVRQIGHEISGLEINIQGRHVEIKIHQLHIQDQIKDMHVENLLIQIDLDQLKDLKTVQRISAKRLAFRDVTRPNESLKHFLQNIRPPSQDTACIEELKIDSLELGVSFSAAPLSLQNLMAQHLCLNENLTSDQLSFDSEDFKLQQNQLQLFAKPSHFWDLQQIKVISFSLKPFLKTDDVL